jgi:hypothetical protein
MHETYSCELCQSGLKPHQAPWVVSGEITSTEISCLLWEKAIVQAMYAERKLGADLGYNRKPL